MAYNCIVKHKIDGKYIRNNNTWYKIVIIPTEMFNRATASK